MEERERRGRLREEEMSGRTGGNDAEGKDKIVVTRKGRRWTK